MINFYNNEIKEWYNEGEVIHKMMGAGSIIYQRLTNSSTPTYYRWITLSGEYLCDGTTKREKQQKQVTHDAGQTWENVVPTTYRMGDVIEYNSEDCGYVPTPTIEYRWINLDPSIDFFCSGTTKMYKQQKQQSEDSGATWTNVVPSEFRMGDSAQTESTDCGYIPPTPIPQYRTTSGTPYCTGYDKYVDVFSQVSYDSGATWETTATTPTLVEHNSEDCGYVPPTPTGNKLTMLYYQSPRYSTIERECDGNTTLTTGETKSGLNIEGIRNAVIGDCVTRINYAAFTNCVNLSSVTISDSVTYIDTSAFGNVGIRVLNIPNSVTEIYTTAFAGCEQLRQINFGTGLTTMAASVFQECHNLTGATLPSSLSYVPAGTFQRCSGMVTTTILDSIEEIRDYAYNGCTSMQEIICLPITPPTISSGNSNNPFNDTNNAPIYVPDLVVDRYKADWSIYADRIKPLSEKP